MKALLFFLLLFPLLSRGQADTTVFSLETGIKITLAKTPENLNGRVGILRVNIASYEVFETNAGQYYTVYSEDGRERRRYLGWPTEHKYEGMSVFSNANGTRFYYLQPDKSGVPYRVEVPGWVFGK